MPRVFISHSTHDRPFVEAELLPVLQENGIEAWYAPNEIRTAEEWERMILHGLQQCDWFLVVMSDGAAASKWVKAEVHWAIDNRDGHIVPLFVRDCNPDDIHLRLRTIQYLDFRTDPSTGRDSLVRIWGKPRSGLGTAISKSPLNYPSASGVPLASSSGTAEQIAPKPRRSFLSFAIIGVLFAGLSMAAIATLIHPYIPTSKTPVSEAVTAGGFKIRIVNEYRGSFVFVVLSGEGDHFIVTRLYLTYLAEFKWRPRTPSPEALNLRTSYFMPLSRDYSEYDLLPQTKDNIAHGYEYKNGESESFGVTCSGFEVAKVQVCATVLNVKGDETYLIKSKEIDMVGSQEREALWNRPLSVKQGRFADQFEPLLYKTLTHADLDGFVDSLDSSLRSRLKEQLEAALSRAVTDKVECFDRLDSLRKHFSWIDQKAAPRITKADAEGIRARIMANANQLGELALRKLLPDARLGTTAVNLTEISKDGKGVDVAITLHYESTLGKRGAVLHFAVDTDDLRELTFREFQSSVDSTKSRPVPGSQDVYRAEIELQEIWRASR